MRQPKTRHRSRFALLVAIMAVVTVAAWSASIALLYDASFAEQRARLLELVTTQARTYEAINRIEAEHVEHGHEEIRQTDVADYVAATHAAHEKFGRGVELVLGARDGDRIVFEMSHRESEHATPPAIPYGDERGEPVRRAIEGESGSMVGIDFRGRRVLAAYEPIAGHDLGLVAKIDVAAIRAPFLRASLAGAMVAAVLIIFGALLFRRINDASTAELERSLIERDLANRAKTEFLANMSHEFRTPLTAIIGYSEAMRAELFGPLGDRRYVEYVDGILGSGRHLHALINEILDLSAIEVGQMETREEVFDVAKVTKSAIQIVQARADEKGMELAVEIEPRISRLRGDERRIRQILVNLLSNAISFSEAGSAVVVKVSRNQDGGVSIAVSDTGVGMEEQQIEAALANFGQLGTPYVSTHGGTGLGLPLVKALTEVHQGSLKIDSEPGKGTTVTVRLPAHRLVGE